MTPFQKSQLKAKYHNPAAKVDGRALRVLESRGLIKDDRVTISGDHALGHFRHCPQTEVPSEELISKYMGQAVLIEDYFVGDEEIGDIYSWSTVSAVEEYKLDAGKVLEAYRRFALVMNADIKRIWTAGYDWDTDTGVLPSGVRSLTLRSARDIAERKTDIFGYYTSPIFFNLAKALMEDAESGKLINYGSHKYSLNDNEDELVPFLADEDAKVVRVFRCDFDQ
ncbi:hypothetical protein [Sulfitobacter sp. R18_1]|uniref:hypothetical protein n=1 Tax=Sulfitobacter sp. R18_1 TaxID=2821104 RepID=UPI001AD9CD3F|nr:hypothetical protein [Sulfitobacter sp. R18_1]MBO9428174.1 hypothetical protein [Sulfitobacter sp. R18_1]